MISKPELIDKSNYFCKETHVKKDILQAGNKNNNNKMIICDVVILIQHHGEHGIKIQNMLYTSQPIISLLIPEAC